LSWLTPETYQTAGLKRGTATSRSTTSGTTSRTALVEYRREFSIGMRRRTLRDPEQRLFLALLLNLPDVTSIQSVLRQIYPERQPGDVLADWVTDLSHPQNKEMSGISLSADSVAQLTGALRACDPKALHAISTSVSPPELLSPLFN
jgi:hypothetical protein